MASEEREVKRLRIRGTVQRIGFRVWVEREALALGLRGWVRNRRDGSVEVLVGGPPQEVAALIDRCWKGPPLSKVESIEVEDAERARPRLSPAAREILPAGDGVGQAGFFFPLNHIQRSRAQHGVSKDGRTRRGLWPSFETRQSKSAVADFDTLVAEVRQA